MRIVSLDHRTLERIIAKNLSLLIEDCILWVMMPARAPQIRAPEVALARRAAASLGLGIGGWRIAEPPRANPTARPPQRNSRKAYTPPMSNLIAKIRHWLHLEKKPKT